MAVDMYSATSVTCTAGCRVMEAGKVIAGGMAAKAMTSDFVTGRVFSGDRGRGGGRICGAVCVVPGGRG